MVTQTQKEHDVKVFLVSGLDDFFETSLGGRLGMQIDAEEAGCVLNVTGLENVAKREFS